MVTTFFWPAGAAGGSEVGQPALAPVEAPGPLGTTDPVGAPDPLGAPDPIDAPAAAEPPGAIETWPETALLGLAPPSLSTPPARATPIAKTTTAITASHSVGMPVDAW